MGCVTGTALAVALTRVLSWLPAAQHIVTGKTSPSVILLAVATSLLVCLLGGALPAYRAAQLVPAQAIRIE
jgi:ABC-type antimicrobial peptide transport system permease subunit